MSSTLRRENYCDRARREMDDSFAAFAQDAEPIKDADLDSDDGLEAALQRELIEMTRSDDAIASKSGGQTPTGHRRGPGKRLRKASLTALCLTLMLAAAPAAEACTGVLYETGTGTYIVGRNMDWNDLTMETDF